MYERTNPKNQGAVDNLARAISSAMDTSISAGLPRESAVAIARAVVEKEEALLHIAAVIPDPNPAGSGSGKAAGSLVDRLGPAPADDNGAADDDINPKS